ncbi:MAG: hypothetical protein H0V50_02615 [Thermoleophilaceae bacterium]|nr:hypothetical protein [Thermoleophilaceae bacterium]
MIGQSTPSEGLSSGLFQPLIVAALVYAALFIAGRVLAGRGDPRGERAGDLAFALMLLMGAYVVVLTVSALASEYELLYDMLVVIGIIVAFFGVLILVLLVIFEKGVGAIGRLRRRG